MTQLFSGEMKIMRTTAIVATETEFSCVRCGAVSEERPRRVLRFMRQAKSGKLAYSSIDPTQWPLSPIGTTQARAVASDLAASREGKKIRVIVTSPHKGATSTALIFANYLRISTVARSKRLVERDMSNDLRDKLDEAYFERIMRLDYCPQGLSPLEEFEMETKYLLSDCATNPRIGSDTLFVTHTLRIATLFKIIKGWTPKMMANWRPPNNCGMLVFGIGSSCEECNGLMYEAA